MKRGGRGGGGKKGRDVEEGKERERVEHSHSLGGFNAILVSIAREMKRTVRIDPASGSIRFN